jgi:hypothetical protein
LVKRTFALLEVLCVLGYELNRLRPNVSSFVMDPQTLEFGEVKLSVFAIFTLLFFKKFKEKTKYSCHEKLLHFLHISKNL